MISHIRLVNGDELIVNIIEETDANVIINAPMFVDEKVDQASGKSVIILSRYMLFDESQNITINKTHIVTSSPVFEEIGKFYLNSVEYNRRFIDPAILNEIKSVNSTLSQLLDENSLRTMIKTAREERVEADEEEYDEDDAVLDALFNTRASSNTVH